jgi:L-ascorbate metabolism protein UlaG (beta-lactamase superfamily)
MSFPECVVYIDPYLSNNVEVTEGSELRRLFPLPCSPDQVTDAQWVLITHIHIDHCDLHSLLPIAKASPQCRFVCPHECVRALEAAGIPEKRLVVAPESWINLGVDTRLVAVPAAHPTIQRDENGNLRCVGYVIEHEGRRFYHAGDTSVEKELIDWLVALAPFEVAFLPVNERNYYRESCGIIGNMTLREAFHLATDLKIQTLVPMHWDMFSPNSVYREEIELLYRLIQPPFDLRFYPESL